VVEYESFLRPGFLLGFRISELKGSSTIPGISFAGRWPPAAGRRRSSGRRLPPARRPPPPARWQAAEAATRTFAAQPVSLPMWAPVARRFGFDFHAQQDAAEVLTLLFSDLEKEPRLCTALQTHMSATLRREPQCNCIATYEYAAPGELSLMRPVAMATHAASKGTEMPSVAGLLEENRQWQGTDQDDSCRCPHCFAPIPSLRRFDIDRAGSILCLEIKRFVNVATLKGPARMKRLSDSLKLSPVLHIAGHV